MIVFTGSKGLASLPKFDDIDRKFSFKKSLVPQSTHPSYDHCFRHYDYMDRLIANKLQNGLCHESIISKQARETQLELENFRKSLNGFEMVEAIIKRVVPRLGQNALKYDPYDLIRGLCTCNNGSYRTCISKAR